MQSRAPSRIAIIKPCCIGDCVMALPAIDALVAAYPDAELDVFVGKHSAGIFEGMQSVSRIIPIPDIPGWRDLPLLVRRIQTGRYDLIVLLDRSRILKLATRAGRSHRTVAIQHPVSGFHHEADIYLDAARRIGATPANAIPYLQLSEAVRERANAAANSFDRPFVVLHPGGAMNPGSVMPRKRWPADRYVSLTTWLQERGLGCALTGGQDDRELCQSILAESGIVSAANVAGELTLLETAAVIGKARLFVGPDTGISHLAAATGTPSVIIFGPTNPLRYGPRGESVKIVAPAASSKIADVDLRKAPTNVARVSTDMVTVEEVLEACDTLLSQAARSNNCVN